MDSVSAPLAPPVSAERDRRSGKMLNLLGYF